MVRRSWLLAAVVVLLGITLGCEGLARAPESATAPAEESGAPLPNLPGAASNAQWPADLPADIPVLDARITRVMGTPDSNLRLFLEPLSAREVEDYVALCEQNGFTVEYIVYVEPGFPDDSEERLKKGDFDAVDFAKDHIFMRLEHGSDLATLDIRIASTEPQPSPTPMPWPADLNVPPPEGCAVRNIANLSYGGYQIACDLPEVDARLEDYMQTLSALGFEEAERLINDDDEIVHVLLESASWSVKLMPHALSSTLTLQITPK